MRLNLAAIRENDRHTNHSRLDLEFDTGIAHRDDPLELEAHLVRVAQLPGNMPFSQVLRMVDHRRGHNETAPGFPLGGEGMKSVGKFLGDETSRQPSLAPAR